MNAAATVIDSTENRVPKTSVEGSKANMSFNDFGLNDKLIKAIYEKPEFRKPTPIQQQAIPVIISGRDVIVQAQPGVGKTFMIALTLCQLINIDMPYVQAVVLSPTNSLARQMEDIITELGQYMHVKAYYGGTPAKDVHVISHTPTNVVQLINKKFMRTSGIKLVVLDEADSVLTKFNEDTKIVLKNLRRNLQVVIVSTTLPKEILGKARHYVKDPVEILLKNDQIIPCDIRHYYIVVKEEDMKFKHLLRTLDNIRGYSAIVYCNTKKQVSELADGLVEILFAHGFSRRKFQVYSMKRDIPSGGKMSTLESFVGDHRDKVLISKDFILRGIDIQVNLVINFFLPDDREDFIHRIGRFGFSKGIVLTIVTGDELKSLKGVMQHFDRPVDRLPIDADDWWRAK